MINKIDMSSMLAQIEAMKISATGGLEQTQPASKGDFGELFNNSITAVNETQMQAGKMSTAFERGDPNVDVAEVMLALQKASISFQAMTEVRNKLLDAYQDIKNMPI